MAYQPPTPKIIENYDHIKSHLTNQDRSILIEVRNHLLLLAEQYGIGYSETIYRGIIALEFIHQGLKCEGNVVVNAKWDEIKIGSQFIQHLLVENRILILVRATMNHGSTLDFTSTQSFLNALGVNTGIVINFGRRNIQINGVAA